MKVKTITLRNEKYGCEDIFVGEIRVGSVAYESLNKYVIRVNIPGIKQTIEVNKRELVFDIIEKAISLFINKITYQEL